MCELELCVEQTHHIWINSRSWVYSVAELVLFMDAEFVFNYVSIGQAKGSQRDRLLQWRQCTRRQNICRSKTLSAGCVVDVLKFDLLFGQLCKCVASELNTFYDLDISLNGNDTYPKRMCDKCYMEMKKLSRSKTPSPISLQNAKLQTEKAALLWKESDTTQSVR